MDIHAQVALLGSPTSFFDPLFLINRVVDIVYMIDIVVQFCLITEKPGVSASKGTVWLTKPGEIAANGEKAPLRDPLQIPCELPV